jgi:4-hydroxy-2-oxoheptanedioate aldolase
MRRLRDDLAHPPLWGAFVCSNSPLVAEILARSGFDWLVVDTQHAPSSGSGQLASMLQAIGLADVPALVRIPWKTDFASAMWALDAGAQGVIVPMVDTVAEAAAISQACKYPPAGFRSFGPWRVAMQFDRYDTDQGDAHAICLVQIETRGGVDNLDAILAVPTVDGVYIGPQDLSLSHGAGLDWHHDNTVLHALAERILASCRQAGKIAVAHTADPGEAVYWGSLGFDMVTSTSDTHLMGLGAQAAVETLRAGHTAAEPGT